MGTWCRRSRATAWDRTPSGSSAECQVAPVPGSSADNALGRASVGKCAECALGRRLTSRAAGEKAAPKNEVGDGLGTIRLFYSRHCGTNWAEVRVSRRGSGEITVFTGSKRHYRPGSGTTPKACG
ncbi:hypothetical protein GCM10012278_88830 [Nonomuraea glycinis]|uniref:DUF2690 domain-containing protein n=1 Tax=Nonomuraea glycinis TaxID=2047744 RepID=A0A918EBD9_9ACTN|nr:hypothetical protein GCM10012278_88830 [Nonomuraea glycinis]